MVLYLTLIFTCHFIGEFIVVLTQAPVPGPVVGMLLLFIGLMIKGRVPDELGRIADTLLKHLSLLFVPAGVGIMLHFNLVREELVPLGGALVVSTVIAIAVTGLLMKWLSPKKEGEADAKS